MRTTRRRTRSTSNEHSMPFEMERGSSTVEYVAVFTVTPGERERGPTYDCAGTPGCAASVDSWEVFLETGKALERRPELDDLVTEEELLTFAGCEDVGPDPDDERDRRRDARFDGAARVRRLRG